MSTWNSPAPVLVNFNFNGFTWTVWETVRSAVHGKARPVIYLYSTGGNNGYSGHYGISSAYKTYDNWLYSDVLVFNNAEKDPAPNGWVNVTNRWSTYGGAYALVEK
ncbi:hypothetical protein HNR42_001598 [Deinobacterium chartae]|uniref:Uncharacterized protein n=1 Tax=Deinobacterium chartae TaxID=521158 RepID=A0A841HZ29_9DEIO|nr:hypothetical protein [Deinobacterium chartae]MBB6098173.1 hypothetical protein [Deinobacterium chartae]